MLSKGLEGDETVAREESMSKGLDELLTPMLVTMVSKGFKGALEIFSENCDGAMSKGFKETPTSGEVNIALETSGTVKKGFEDAEKVIGTEISGAFELEDDTTV